MIGKALQNASEGDVDAAVSDEVLLGSLPSTLGFKMRRVQLAYKRQFARSAADSGFQLRDVGALSLICRNPDITPSALAKALTVDAAQITNILKLLEAKGLISRRKSPTDSRSRALRLTDKGQLEYERLKAIIGEVEQSFVANVLSPAETAQLLGLLGRLEDEAQRRG